MAGGSTTSPSSRHNCHVTCTTCDGNRRAFARTVFDKLQTLHNFSSRCTSIGLCNVYRAQQSGVCPSVRQQHSVDPLSSNQRYMELDWPKISVKLQWNRQIDVE